jgi:hypothetical protein
MMNIIQWFLFDSEVFKSETSILNSIIHANQSDDLLTVGGVCTIMQIEDLSSALKKKKRENLLWEGIPFPEFHVSIRDIVYAVLDARALEKRELISWQAR